jgi:hypothetical protein
MELQPFAAWKWSSHEMFSQNFRCTHREVSVVEKARFLRFWLSNFICTQAQHMGDPKVLKCVCWPSSESTTNIHKICNLRRTFSTCSIRNQWNPL